MTIHGLTKIVPAAWLVLLMACDSDVKPAPTPVAPTSPSITPALATPIVQDTPGAAPVTPELLTPTPVVTVSDGGAMGCIAAGPRAGRDSIGDPFYPQLGNAGYDAQHY